MKEFYLDYHTFNCPCSKPKDSDNYWLRICELNPERFIFYLKNNFYLITYHTCNNLGNHIDYKKLIIESAIGQNKVYPIYKVNKSVNIERDLKNFRLHNKNLRKHIQEVNYTYSDNANNIYAITTTVSYLEAIADNEQIHENFKKAKEFLEKMEYNWLIKDLFYLYNNNIIAGESEVEYVKTIDHLINLINKQTK